MDDPKKGNQSPQKTLKKNLEMLLRGSVNSQLSKADYDQRKMNMLNCLRKFFEEART